MSLRRLFPIVILIGFCFILTGCPTEPQKPAPSPETAPATAPSTDTTAPDAATTDAAASPKTPWKPSEPAIQYYAMDAPAGMSQAVVVEGFPLVYTRQLLPLDKDGKLVGEGDAEKQIGQVLDNLAAVLEATGSDLDKLVKLDVFADSPATVDLLRGQLAKRMEAGTRPAITAVVSPLPTAGALVAVDAVAVTSENATAVTYKQSDAVAGTEGCADAAIIPVGGTAYISGQPDKSQLPEAVDKSMTALMKVVDQLKLQPSQIVQLKAFVQSAAEADRVRGEMKKHFPDGLLPPVVFVEWIASAPVEIEMVVYMPLKDQPAETVWYFADAKPSPTFSRAALVGTDRQIFISGLTGRAAGDGQSQVRDVFDQLKAILAATESDLDHLAKAMYYVSDEDAGKQLDKLRPEYYNPQRPPAASKVMVHGAGATDRTFVMDMIAVGSGKK